MAIVWESLKDNETVAKALYKEYFKYPNNDEFEILSTIRYDPQLSNTLPDKPSDITKDNFFLFEGHIQRLQYTVNFFNNELSNSVKITSDDVFDKLVKTIEEANVDLHEPLKIRFLVNVKGSATIELHSTPKIDDLFRGLKQEYSDEDIWDVYVDSNPIVISPFTSFKTTYRPHYTNARDKCLPGLRPGKEEVLLVNQNNLLMEGSITNFAMKWKDEWVTPTLQSGCLCGVARHHLISKELITQMDFDIKSIEVGDDLLLFNGIMGVVKARVKAII